MAQEKARGALNNKYEIDMIHGPLLGKILLFSLPLMASSVLQLLFNAADVVVVGQFAGSNSLAAVGSTGSVINLLVALFIGISIGTNVLVARYYAMGQDRDVSETVHTSIFLALIGGIIMGAVGIIFSRGILILMASPKNVLELSATYLRIYFAGVPMLCIYNMGAATLRAIGDTRRPLYFLLISGVLNVVLNLFFVIGFHLDAAGVALASAISQYFSAFVILKSLFHMNESQDVYLRKEDMHMDKDMAKSILALGIPTGLQNSIFAIANLFIQGAVNSFDTLIVEGNSAAANSDALVYDVMAAFYAGGTTFIAQNYGAGNKKRILDSYHISVVMAFIAAVAMGLCLFLFGPQFLHLFTNDPQVIEAGMLRLRIMSYSYCVSAFMDGTIAASRGIGRTTVPMIIVILGSCLFRILWIYTIFAYFHTIPALYDLYIASWSLTALFEIIYFRKEYKKVCNG